MKYHNPLIFLVGVMLAFFLLASFARAEDQFDEDARAAIAVALALEDVKVKAVDPPCSIDGCKCGCADGGACTCSSPKNKTGDRKNGYTYADDGYWYKDVVEPAPVVQTYNHYFPPEAYSQWATMQEQPQPSPMQRLLFAPQQIQGFGGMRGSPRGCAGGS